MKEEMRGLFYIVKGHYRKNVGDSFTNSENDSVMYLGGYDPYENNTPEWYMLMDCNTHQCLSCGSDYEKVLRGVYNVIRRNKGVMKKYLKYRTQAPKISPVMENLYEHLYEEFGDYFNDDIREMEDLAYYDLQEDKPFRRAKKLVKTSAIALETHREEKVIDTSTPKKSVKNKVKFGIKKLLMEQ